METATAASDLRFPVGKFDNPASTTASERKHWMDEIAALPHNLRAAVAGLNDSQLDTPYRPGGWTVRQVVHHIADSHMTSYMRFKVALTEDTPTIKPYDEARCAELGDASAEIETTLALLDHLHRRWMVLLTSMSDADFKRAFNHPERGPVRLDQTVALYAWHSRHHVGHITSLRSRMNW